MELLIGEEKAPDKKIEGERKLKEDCSVLHTLGLLYSVCLRKEHSPLPNLLSIEKLCRVNQGILMTISVLVYLVPIEKKVDKSGTECNSVVY